MPEARAIEDLLEHAALARRLARALVGDAARADDVVQQTWLSALEHPPHRGHGLKAWLATVVRNSAAKLRRDEARREAREQQAATPEPLPSTDEVVAQIAAQRALLDAVARLDEPGRSTIHARFFEQRTPTQIAAAQGIPVRTVETRLRRAIEKLRADLDEKVAGGRRAWVGLLVGGSAVAIKTKSASAIGITALVVATAATVVLTVVHVERRSATPVGAPAPAVAQATPESTAATNPAAAVADAKSATAPTRDPAATAITVLSPDGLEMAGAAVVLFRGEEVLGEATTDANGSASVPIQETPCRLLVAPCCAPSKVVEVAAKSTAIEVTYDDGAIFSGHVTVDGAPPATPVELVLQAEAPLVPAVEIPDPVAMRLRTLRTAYSWQLAAKSDRDGAFAFFGLAPHVRFTVQIAAPYENAATGETWARFDEAQQDVELALHFNPSIHGRIVDTSGAPLPGWHVEGWAGSPDEWDSEAPVDSDARGDFRLFLHQSHHGGTTFARLYVCDPGGTSIRRVDIGQTVDRGFDVGDVVVDLRKIVTLVPRDANGLPLSLFAVVVEHATRAGELPCRPVRDVVDAAHARAGLVLADDVKTLRLLAPGCAAVDVPAVPANAPVEVVLPAAATLEFDVRDPDGKRPSGCTLELAGPKWPGAWSREELVAAHVALGGSPLPWEGERDRTAQSFRIGASKDGVFRALALLPELATTLVVRDSLGAEVLRDEVVLQAGETRKLERTLANDAVTLAGFVHDVDGTPLKKTRIEWRTGTAVQLVWTGEDGRFRVEGVRAPRVTLVFQASGHAWKWLRDLDVRAVPGELDVELKPGHSTRCGFVGANGASAATAVWIESVASRPFPDGADLPPEGADRCDGESEGDVGYGFAELPASELRLRARIDGFTFALSVERDCEVNYNTTVHGPVEIDWSVAATASNGRTLTALRLLPLERRGARATIPIGAAAAAAGSGLARIDKIAIDRYTVALVWSDAAGSVTEEKTDVVVDVSKQESARVTLTR